MLDGSSNSTIFSNYVSEYFLQKNMLRHNISISKLEELIGDINHIPKNIFELICHPDNQPHETQFLIDVFYDIIDFFSNPQSILKAGKIEFINFALFSARLINIQQLEYSLSEIYEKYPLVYQKYLDFYDTSTFEYILALDNELPHLSINAQDNKNAYILPFQQKVIEKFIGNNPELKFGKMTDFFILCQKSKNSNPQYLIDIAKKHLNEDTTCLFNDIHRTSEKSLLIKTFIKKQSSISLTQSTINQLRVFTETFNKQDFSQIHPFLEPLNHVQITLETPRAKNDFQGHLIFTCEPEYNHFCKAFVDTMEKNIYMFTVPIFSDEKFSEAITLKILKQLALEENINSFREKVLTYNLTDNKTQNLRGKVKI